MPLEMLDDHIAWRWQENDLRLGVTRMGAGPGLLMLPALSSISTRGEMRPLAQRLAADFSTLAIDWPGFGDAPRPAMRWHPDAYRAFLAEILALERPFATIAAGHAAGYTVEAAATKPGSAGRLALIAPTWRGPLPTVMGKRHKAFGRIARAGDLPVIGTALYRLNVNPFMVRKMALGHVYRAPAALPESLFVEKIAVTRAAGARHASIRFVTGELIRCTAARSFSPRRGACAIPFFSCSAPKRRRGPRPRWKRLRRCPTCVPFCCRPASSASTRNAPGMFLPRCVFFCGRREGNW